MIYFIELWNAKPEWIALTKEERATYMQNVGGAIQGLLEQGVKVLSWSKNDEATTKRTGYEYFAIWGFPSQEIAESFQQLVEGAGWYNYFEQVNAMGKEDSVENTIGELIAL